MDNYILFTILLLLIICSLCYLNMYMDIESFESHSFKPFD